MGTPKYLTCPCGYPLSEETTFTADGKIHRYRCIRCGHTREKTNG